MVTELGRQPWIISGILRTQDAVTKVQHLQVPFLLVSALYCVLGVIVVWLLAAHVIAEPNNRDADAV
jgi:cytochrome d ubiquinol oxidase subunit I